jgi:hypothetical protein
MVKRPFCKNGPFVQNGDFHIEIAHKCHVVLYDYHRTRLVDFPEQPGSFRSFRIGHAGNGFVHQQQLRILSQQRANFEPLLLAVREIRRERVPRIAQMHRFQQFSNCVVLLAGQLRKQRGKDTTLRAQREQNRSTRSLRSRTEPQQPCLPCGC